MTEMNKNDAKKEDARIQRRKILKAGAVIAPLAVTLHGGAAFAHVSSAGRCVQNMKENLIIPKFKYKKRKKTYKVIGSENFSPSTMAKTGRKFNHVEEDHWDYVLREELAGQTCLQSFATSGENRFDL